MQVGAEAEAWIGSSRRRSCPLVGAAGVDLTAPGCAHVSGAAPTPVGGDWTTVWNATTVGGHRDCADRQGVESCDSFQKPKPRRIRTHFDKELEGPVTLDLFIEPKSAIVVPGRPECELCDETRALLEDVASLSDQITLTVHDIRTESDLARETGVSRVPTLVLRGAARGVLRYLGIPAGLEFGTLLGSAAVSRGTTTLKQESRTKLASLTKPVHVQVFVTPTCPYCPKVASLAHQAAVESGNVIADVIEISEFPDLAAQYQRLEAGSTEGRLTDEHRGARSMARDSAEAAFVCAAPGSGVRPGPGTGFGPGTGTCAAAVAGYWGVGQMPGFYARRLGPMGVPVGGAWETRS